ncbi:MAG: glycosyltransferase [Bacteroidota bacterium]
MKKKVLVAPLDWGLGHASRCIPLITALLKEGVEVHLGGSGKSILLLREYFPDLPYHDLPAYDVQYTSGKYQVWKILLQLPAILKTIREEHRTLNRLIKEHSFSAVISDNRYGLWSKEIYSVILCHQIQIPLSYALLSKWVNAVHVRYLNRFDVTWIPDVQGDRSLAGRMSHASIMPRNHQYLGTLSRFQLEEAKPMPTAYDVLCVISGPEPQRTMFEEELRDVFQGLDQRVCLVQGKPGPREIKEEGNMTVINHLPSTELQQLLLSSTYVISRSGYSSLMDYAALGLKKVGLIPTPGQPEQEYLARRMEEKGFSTQFQQGELNWEEMKGRMEEVGGFRSIEKLSVDIPDEFWDRLKS